MQKIGTTGDGKSAVPALDCRSRRRVNHLIKPSRIEDCECTNKNYLPILRCIQGLLDWNREFPEEATDGWTTLGELILYHKLQTVRWQNLED